MRRERISIRHLICLFFFLHLLTFRPNAEELEDDYSKGCAHRQCANGGRCIKRRFWCKTPPCPGMLYCYTSRREMLKGPPTCDTVRCNKGHLCIIRVRECDWHGRCKQQVARCISEKEYHEDAISCFGVECSSRERCILKETSCVNPPCKLVRTCADAKDVEKWLDECRSLNCISQYECFLRRPENNCSDPWCIRTPACTLTIGLSVIPGDELISKHCYGWICPQGQRCVVQIVDTCRGSNCTIERSCRASSTATHNTTNKPFSGFFNSSATSTSPPATFLAGGNVESSTLRDTKRLEVLKKIYIATDDDALPLSMVLEGINLVGQGYPIWMRSEPYQSVPLKVRDEDDGDWRYSVQEPYRILLPPYEPVIYVEDVRRREQFLPFLAYTFDYPFDETASMTEVTKDTGNSKTDDFPMTVNGGKISNYINRSTIVEMENSETNHVDDLSGGDYANFPATSSIPPNIHDKELNNYYDDERRPSYMIHDYTERNEPTLVHKLKSSVVGSATDNLYEERYDFNHSPETISVRYVNREYEEATSSGGISDKSLNGEKKLFV